MRKSKQQIPINSMRSINIFKVLEGMLGAVFLFMAIPGWSDAPQSQSPYTTIIYFVRHAEDVPEMVGDPTLQATVTLTNCNAAGSCCLEVLNPLGEARAAAWADWFKAQRFTDTLTHVIASHKIRTRQSVQKIAQAAGLGGDVDGDGDLDGTDIDQAPGDGVINVPSTPGECDPGFTGAGSSRQPQIDYLKTLPLGSRAVLCAHSPTLYPIMRAFGIDTSDPIKFPKNPTDPTRVGGFNNLWIVQFDLVGGAYQGRLLEHLFLNFNLEASVVNREFGRGPENEEE